MPKQFYTEKDIEDMARSGVTSLEIAENVVLTELAYEKARALGMNLIQAQPDNPPCAPVRPYLSMRQGAQAAASVMTHSSTDSSRAGAAVPAHGGDGLGLEVRIRNAVVARLGGQVDAGLLDVIIRRVVNSTGTKEPVCCSAESGAQRCAPSSTAGPKG